MIIESEKDVTKAVLTNTSGSKIRGCAKSWPRSIRHLHDFTREVKLTEDEFHAAIAYIVAIGQNSNETHNEAVLMAGSLGLSPLVCLLNNGDHGQTETDANMLGPFWRMNSPPTQNGDTIMRSPTPGPELFVDAWFRDTRASRSSAPKSTSGIPRPKALREPGSGPGRHESARQVHHRQGRPYLLPQRQAGRLSDPDRRAGRRNIARRGPAQYAARRICTFWSTSPASRP